MKLAKAVFAATKNVVSFPAGQGRREKDELAFLPAALEIVETPPSPIGRAIGATVVALFCLALVWAAFGHVDVVSSASGKVVPDGRVKLIQPFETGVVRTIHVRDGQNFKVGDLLIELDPTMTVANQAHIRSDLVSAQPDIARLRAVLSNSDDPHLPPALASAGQISRQRQLLAGQMEEYRAKLASLDRQRVQKEAESGTVAAMISKLEASAPLIEQRVDILKSLADRQLGSKLTYLESLQAMTENQQELGFRKAVLMRQMPHWRQLSRLEAKKPPNFVARCSASFLRRNARLLASRSIC